MRTSFIFKHEYEVELGYELTGRDPERLFYFPGASQHGGKDGALVKIIPRNGEAWFGIFSSTSPGGITENDGIYSCPDAQTLCVVCGGNAYLGKVNNPSSWKVVSTNIGQVFQIPAHGLILFIEWTDIIAYAAKGETWRTERIGWDGIRVNSADESYIYGQIYDPTYDKGTWIDFKIDIKTRKLEGYKYPLGS